MDILVKVVLPLGLAFIMFSLGLGLTVDDFKRVAKRPAAFLTGGVSQIILVPLAAYLMILLFGITAELAVGVMILSFCPGGVTSNIICKLAKGDVALSVSLTAVVSLLSMFTVPVLVAWSMVRFMGADAPDFSIVSLSISVFLITTLPVLIGIAVRHYATDFANRVEGMASTLATALFVIIVVAALAANWTLFIDNLMVLGPALIALNVVLIFLGSAIAKVSGRTLDEIKTIAIETGVQNSTVGIAVGTLIAVETTGFSAFSLPAAVYGITMYVITLPVIIGFRRMQSGVAQS